MQVQHSVWVSIQYNTDKSFNLFNMKPLGLFGYGRVSFQAYISQIKGKCFFIFFPSFLEAMQLA